MPDFAGVTGGKDNCAMCGVVEVLLRELSRMNDRAFSAILFEGNSIALSDGLPYRSRQSFAN